MDNPVTPFDVADRWRPLTSQEFTVVQALLDDAWALLTGPSGRPTLSADLDAGTVSVPSVVRVVTAMVLRVMRNPDGKVSETIDDYSWRRADSVAAGALFVSDEELAELTPGVARAGGAFTIRQVGVPRSVPTTSVAGPTEWPSVYVR